MTRHYIAGSIHRKITRKSYRTRKLKLKSATRKSYPQIKTNKISNPKHFNIKSKLVPTTSQKLSINPRQKHTSAKFQNMTSLSKKHYSEKGIIPEMARNPSPPDKSLLSSPTPAIDSHMATVMRDSIIASSHIINMALKPHYPNIWLLVLEASNPFEMHKFPTTSNKYCWTNRQ